MAIRLVTKGKIAETSSKGNQEKWCEDGRWYKLDQFGYEALAEVFVSKILNYVTFDPSGFLIARVPYEIEKVTVGGRERVCCSSKNFLQENESIITLNRLHTLNLGHPLIAELESMSSDKKRIQFLAEKTAEITAAVKTGIPNYFGLQRFGAMKSITHKMGYHILRGEFEEAVTLYVGDAFPYESDEIKAARSSFRETKDAKEALHDLPVHLSYERIMLDSLMKKKDDYGAALQALPPGRR